MSFSVYGRPKVQGPRKGENTLYVISALTYAVGPFITCRKRQNEDFNQFCRGCMSQPYASYYFLADSSPHSVVDARGSPSFCCLSKLNSLYTESAVKDTLRIERLTLTADVKICIPR